MRRVGAPAVGLLRVRLVSGLVAGLLLLAACTTGEQVVERVVVRVMVTPTATSPSLPTVGATETVAPSATPTVAGAARATPGIRLQTSPPIRTRTPTPKRRRAFLSGSPARLDC